MTASNVLVFVTSTIDARENREVVTIDIPGAFLHTTNKDCVVMQITFRLQHGVISIGKIQIQESRSRKILSQVIGQGLQPGPPPRDWRLHLRSHPTGSNIPKRLIRDVSHHRV